ncbi:carboxylesterase/lipase family protein [Erythrobacter sp. 3-20A1M]|uniref:carboxylesterase/lipase family protein n=1 Tax=Erythrobacter sp. 3-20A1M TaxID=2653850 RepID=UPI001BFC1E7B|nr:carboxylesterase family protein [Erythrobacter sp. 3-20A1M]
MMAAAAIGALAVASPLVAQGEPVPQVAVTGGTIAGEMAEGGGALVFRGIPFAAPPIGERRWKAPQPVQPWTGVKETTEPTPACIQNDQGWNRADYLFADEDCLTLDVRTPALSGKRPVMVWIHGGSNKAGSAHGMVESRITDQGVVLVAIQYRLAIFGFLAPRGAAAEAGGHAGNYGLMDQIAALQWVHENIAKFGGDPDDVTIFGESAGSQDVSLMLAAPQARGLFGRAIMQSGTPGFGMPFRSQEEAFAIADQTDKLLDTGGSIEKLRRTSVNALLDADLKLEDKSIQGNGLMWLKTTVDGVVLPDSPKALLAKAPKKPVIIGSNRAEFGPPAGTYPIEAMVGQIYGPNAAKALAFYDFDGADHDPRLGHPQLEVATDYVFRCPANNLATMLAGEGWPVWRYEFDLSQDGGLTAHAKDVAYVMDSIAFGGGVSLQDYWTNFARTGDPNGKGVPQWPRWQGRQKAYVLFDDTGVTKKSDLRGDLCELLPPEL